jgi:hypothetical protein
MIAVSPCPLLREQGIVRAGSPGNTMTLLFKPPYYSSIFHRTLGEFHTRPAHIPAHEVVRMTGVTQNVIFRGLYVRSYFSQAFHTACRPSWILSLLIFPFATIRLFLLLNHRLDELQTSYIGR